MSLYPFVLLSKIDRTTPRHQDKTRSSITIVRDHRCVFLSFCPFVKNRQNDTKTPRQNEVGYHSCPRPSLCLSVLLSFCQKKTTTTRHQDNMTKRGRVSQLSETVVVSLCPFVLLSKIDRTTPRHQDKTRSGITVARDHRCVSLPLYKKIQGDPKTALKRIKSEPPDWEALKDIDYFLLQISSPKDSLNDSLTCLTG